MSGFKEVPVLIQSSPIPPFPPSPAVLENLTFMSRIRASRTEGKQELTVEWKRIFGKNIIEGERLVWVFRCALAKPTLLEGREKVI